MTHSSILTFVRYISFFVSIKLFEFVFKLSAVYLLATDFLVMLIDCQGRLHKGGMVRDAPWRKLRGELCDDNDAFVRVHNNLLLHECIYYFTPVHF